MLSNSTRPTWLALTHGTDECFPECKHLPSKHNLIETYLDYPSMSYQKCLTTDNCEPNGTADTSTQSGQNPTPDMTVTLAVRASDFEFYAERLRLRDNCNMDGLTTILVDDGSPENISNQLEDFCNQRNWKYIFLDTRDTAFSLARARNAALQVSESEWVFTDDADNIYQRDFFQRLLKEVAVMDDTPFDFLTIPHVYLSQLASDRIRATGELDSHVPWLLARTFLENPRGEDLNNYAIQHYAPASAMLALRRKTALLAGAYDTTFEGWGGEDRDFIYRLLLLNPNLPKPDSFEITKKWNMNDTHVYEGWRSLYRMLGEYMGRKGFYAFHLYHDWNSWRTHSGSNHNRDYAAEKAMYYYQKRKVPCVASLSKPRDIIIGFNPFITDRRVLMTLDNPEIIDDPRTSTASEYVDEALSQPVNSVIMWNPYINSWSLDIYNEFISKGIVPIVGERGALPDTIYFDKGGLCAESDSYHEKRWARTLDEGQLAKARTHIERVRYGADALEKQAGRIGAWKLRQKLGVSESARILFAPLQLQDDTVIKFFSDEGRTYEDYLADLSRLSASLPGDWVLVFKNHPLSQKKASFESGLCGDEFHINDLLQACDAVSVFNSGTGLLAQAFEKPVLYYGHCFYAIDGVNWKFLDLTSATEFLSNLPTPDMSKIYQFFYYLNEEFYSIAEMKSTIKVGSEHSLRAVLQQIEYRTIRIPGFEHRHFAQKRRNFYLSPLFDVYRYHEIASRRQTAQKEASTQMQAASRRAERSPTEAAEMLGSAARKRASILRNHEAKPGYTAKSKKLRRNPHAFFKDAKIPALRPFRFLFPVGARN